MTKHGHGLPRKRPGRSAKDAIDAQLPELEPLEELPELEPVEELPELEAIEEDEGPVKGACVACDEDGFDTLVTLEVPDMPKKEVADAVEGPLQRIAGSFGAMLRHQKVLVRFTGDGLVGSAVKGIVAELLGAQKPLLVVVKRGFGDETVHEGELPTVGLQKESADGATKVTVDAGGCESADLPAAMAPHVAALVGAASGARFVFQFRGGAKPDAQTRAALATALRDGGARSVAVGARVLFDLDVEDKIQCAVSGGEAVVSVALEAADEDVVDALSLVLPKHKDALDGANARFELGVDSDAVRAFCVDFARDAGATRVAVGGADGARIVWPPLISIRAGQEVELRLTPNGRSREELLTTFVREVAEHHDDTAGKDVVVDWPEDFALDADAIGALEDATKAMAPHRLACTVHGDAREPFLPAPVHFGADGDVQTVVVETESGKPKELQRAIDRRLPGELARLKGQAVRVVAHGDVPMSRTLRQNLCGAVAEAGPARLELSEGGAVDVLLPPMVSVTEAGEGLTIGCDVDGRDEAQQRRAVARELEGVEVALKCVTVEESSAAQLVADYAMEQGASQVLLGGAAPVRLHPPLFEVVEKKGKQARFVVEPTGDAAMDARMVDAELPGRLEAAGMLAGATVTVSWPGGAADGDAVGKVVAALRDKKASKVLLDCGEGEPVQVHPDPQPEPAPEAAAPAPEAAAPAAEPAPASSGATSSEGMLTVLARSDAAAPPMVVLGVAAGDDEAHLTALVGELEQHLARFTGRAVLLVPRRDGADVPVRRATPLVQLLAQAFPQTAAATLVFRGPDDQGRDHFEVLHSNVAELPVGVAFADPRSK